LKISFIGIGPGKSGTTWLYRTLQRHPEIVMSQVKETNYFNDNYARGDNWYSNLFRVAQDDVVIGEISNTYIFTPVVAERIYKYDSGIKVITILRDPIERAVSHYLFLVRNGEKFNSFSDAIKARPDLLDRGLYSRHLEPYFKLFPKDQIFVGLFDDLRNNSQEFADRLFLFLEVSPQRILIQDSDKLKASKPRFRIVAQIVKRVATMIRALGRPIIVEKIKRLKILSHLYQPIDYNTRALIQHELPFLIEYYSKDIDSCSAIVGRDLRSLWLNKYDL
jgi:hypothetical protein